jgi:hypothetical protein
MAVLLGFGGGGSIDQVDVGHGEQRHQRLHGDRDAEDQHHPFVDLLALTEDR